VYGQTVATSSAANRPECNAAMGLTMSIHPVCLALVDLCTSLHDTAGQNSAFRSRFDEGYWSLMLRRCPYPLHRHGRGDERRLAGILLPKPVHPVQAIRR